MLAAGYLPGAMPNQSGTSLQVFGAMYDRRVAYCAFTDGILYDGSGKPVEPDTDYFYRLYLMDSNREVVPSNVVRIHTLPFRSRFLRLGNNRDIDFSSLSLRVGGIEGGDTVAISGYFVPGTRATLYGKEMPVVSLTSSLLTLTTPVFANPDLRGRTADIALLSPSGLADVFADAWRFT
jgi:hypothetical protein